MAAAVAAGAPPAGPADGAPVADFIEDVDAFMVEQKSRDCDVFIERQRQNHKKYSYLQRVFTAQREQCVATPALLGERTIPRAAHAGTGSTWGGDGVGAHTRRRLKQQLPELKSTLDLVSFLQGSRVREAGPPRHRHGALLSPPLVQDGGEAISLDFKLHDHVYAKGDVESMETVCLWLGADVMLEYPLDEAAALLRSNHTAAKERLATAQCDVDFLRDQITTTEVNIARLYNWGVVQRRAAGGAPPPAP